MQAPAAAQPMTGVPGATAQTMSRQVYLCLGGTAHHSARANVQLARLIVANLTNYLCLDPDRIYATGFSNGAMLSQVRAANVIYLCPYRLRLQRLACEAWDLFKAAASVSGIVELKPGMAEGLAECSAAYKPSPRSTSVIDIHGDLDIVVPWTGDAIFGYPTVPDNLKNWTQRNDCSGPASVTLNKTFYTNQVE